MAAAKVSDHGSYTPHSRRFALCYSVFSQWRVDPGVHMGVDQAWKGQQSSTIKDLFSLPLRNFRCDSGKLAVFHTQVQEVDGLAVRPDDAYIFDDKVQFVIV